MKRSALWALALAGAILLGFSGYETVTLRVQAAQLATLQQSTARLGENSSALRRQHAALAQDLAAAERQLAALPGPPALTPIVNVTPKRQQELKAWLARQKHLRQLFVERPAAHIPEMQLLTDEDWLRVAHAARFDSVRDTNRALAAIRDAAIEKFRPRLRAALSAFAKTSDETTLATIQSLAPQFDPPLDPAILPRYELTKSAQPPARSRVQWNVQLKAPVDPDHDSQFTLDAADNGNSGGMTQSAPSAWIPNFRERSMQAYKDYMAANSGARPKGAGDTFPFFKPPLDSATTEKLLRAARDFAR